MSHLDPYYELLGLRPGASPNAVKQAYRDRVKQWHPDQFHHNPRQRQEAEVKLRAINEAYEWLKDYQPGVASPSSRSPGTAKVSTKASGAEVYYNQGAEKVKAGHYKEALEDFNIAIRLNPNYAEAYRYRGFVHSLLGFELGAEADLKKAKELGLRSEPPDRASQPQQPNPSSRPPEPPAPRIPRWQCVQTLSGHGDRVSAIALSRDGKILASASLDKIIRLWNLKTGKNFGTLSGHTDGITSLALSSDGQLLASGSLDQTIRLWHLGTGSLLRVLTGHTGAVTAITLSPDRHFLVSGSLDTTVRIWDLQTGKLHQPPLRHAVSMQVVAISPDGVHLMAAGADRMLRIYQLRTGELLRRLNGHCEQITAIALSPSGQQFVTGSKNGELEFWNDASLVTGSSVRVCLAHGNAINAIVFSADGQQVMTASSDRTVQLWQPDGIPLGTLVENGHPITGIAVQPETRTLITSSTDGIKRWQPPSV